MVRTYRENNVKEVSEFNNEDDLEGNDKPILMKIAINMFLARRGNIEQTDLVVDIDNVYQ